MSKKQALQRKIDQFLIGRKKSEGGFAPVDPSEIDQLYGIMQTLLEIKYERDPDGDLPVSVQLTDRTRYMRPMDLPIRHPHLTRDPLHGKPGASLAALSELECYMQAADRLSSMAVSASEMSNRYMRVVQDLMRNHAENHSPIMLGGTRFAVRPPSGLTVEAVQAKLQSLVKAAQKKSPVPDDYRERAIWSSSIAAKATAALALKVLNPVATPIEGGVRIYFDVPCFSARLRVQVGGKAAPVSGANEAASASKDA